MWEMTEEQVYAHILALGTEWLVVPVTMMEKTGGRNSGDSGRDKDRNKKPNLGHDLVFVWFMDDPKIEDY